MIFNATISQMVFLFFLVVIGYILSRFKLIPENAETTLSKLENYIFIPALIMGTFVKNLTCRKSFSKQKLTFGKHFNRNCCNIGFYVACKIAVKG